MSGGVVYLARSGGTPANPSLYGKFGTSVQFANNAPLPAGAWIQHGNYTIIDAAGVQHSPIPGGFVISDGVNCLGGGYATPVGQRP